MKKKDTQELGIRLKCNEPVPMEAIHIISTASES